MQATYIIASYLACYACGCLGSDEVTPSPSAVPPVSTTTTTTTQTTTTNETSTERFTPVRSNGNTGGYSISNAPRSTILVLLILTVTATHIII